MDKDRGGGVSECGLKKYTVQAYIGGFALMVISPKKFNFSPSLCPHWGLFNHMLSLLVISSEPIGRSKS